MGWEGKGLGWEEGVNRYVVDVFLGVDAACHEV